MDTPAEAVAAADTLIWDVMRDRGYPANDRNASMDALSVYHAGSLEGYRQTLDRPAESATTEQLREAMIRHRALFEDLTGLRNGRGQPGRDRVAEIRDRADRNGVVTDRDGRTTKTGDRVAADSNTAAGNRDRAARNSDLAEENGNRTADTPR